MCCGVMCYEVMVGCEVTWGEAMWLVAKFLVM